MLESRIWLRLAVPVQQLHRCRVVHDHRESRQQPDEGRDHVRVRESADLDFDVASSKQCGVHLRVEPVVDGGRVLRRLLLVRYGSVPIRTEFIDVRIWRDDACVDVGVVGHRDRRPDLEFDHDHVDRPYQRGGRGPLHSHRVGDLE